MWYNQALVEVKLLEHLRDHDTDGNAAIVHMRDYFYFRNHMCITFELLCINLYEFIKNNKFQVIQLRGAMWSSRKRDGGLMPRRER